MIKKLFPASRSKVLKTKENGISHLRENDPQLSDEQDSIQDSLFGGGVNPKKFFLPRTGQKNLFRPSRGPSHAASENFENIVFRIGLNCISGH